MSVDKLVDSTQLDADLTSVANAIRTKGGTSASLAFPAGFVSAIQAIPSGGGGTTPTIADYAQTGLIHLWDAEQNTATGHNSTTSTWKDLAGNYDLTVGSSVPPWGDKCLLLGGGSSPTFTISSGAVPTTAITVEVVISCFLNSVAMKVANWGPYNRIFALFSDNTLAFNGASSQSYAPGVAANSLIRTAACVYNSSGAAGSVYVNGASCSQSGNTHSFGTNAGNIKVGGPIDRSYPGAGLIHCIRVYDRALSAQELADNYAVDLARFFATST